MYAHAHTQMQLLMSLCAQQWLVVLKIPPLLYMTPYVLRYAILVFYKRADGCAEL